jgi:hypothetical protein
MTDKFHLDGTLDGTIDVDGFISIETVISLFRLR